MQSELTKQQNMFKIELKLLEDELLTRLSAAESNFLGDNMLVEKLETTKHTAAEIEMKVAGGGARFIYCCGFLQYNLGFYSIKPPSASRPRCWKPKSMR